MKREGHTFRGTRREVVEALEHDIAYHVRFGTPAKAQQADTAVTCIVGGSNRVQVGTFVYEVSETA